MVLAGAYLDERAERCRGLSFVIVSPTSHRTIAPEPAAMLVTDVDEYEGARRRRGLAIIIFTPTSDGSVRLHRASVLEAYA